MPIYRYLDWISNTRNYFIVINNLCRYRLLSARLICQVIDNKLIFFISPSLQCGFTFCRHRLSNTKSHLAKGSVSASEHPCPQTRLHVLFNLIQCTAIV